MSADVNLFALCEISQSSRGGGGRNERSDNNNNNNNESNHKLGTNMIFLLIVFFTYQ